MAKTGPGKMLVPAIVCAGGQSAASAPALGMTCAKLDAGVSVEWVGTPPTVEFPSSANQPGKLPYTLPLMVTVEENGKVTCDRNGSADNDFSKKAAESWK